MPKTQIISTGKVRLLSSQEVADQLGKTEKGMWTWRKQGKGPPWFKIEGSIRYREDLLEDWLIEQQEKMFK